jgi:hypothetical protein
MIEVLYFFSPGGRGLDTGKCIFHARVDSPNEQRDIGVSRSAKMLENDGRHFNQSLGES